MNLKTAINTSNANLEIPNLTDTILLKRLGPKKTTDVFTLSKEDISADALSVDSVAAAPAKAAELMELS